MIIMNSDDNIFFIYKERLLDISSSCRIPAARFFELSNNEKLYD